MSTQQIINDIKKELHANMNGIASAYMRQNGPAYRLNWGIELPRLKAIAAEFEPNHRVAQRLWQEDVRESRILATLLMPAEDFDAEICQLWAEQIPNAEIAQMTVMNLFARLPYAADMAFRWLASDREMLQLCGLLLVTRLLINGSGITEQAKNEVVDQARSLITSPNLHVRKAAQNTILRLEEEA